MSYQLKYFFKFRDLNDQEYTLNIYEDSASTFTPFEVTGYIDPFKVEYFVKEKFDPVKGSGATIQLLSETDRQFLNLYTADMMQYKVKLFKGTVLKWTGYLDSELYREPFDSIDNYPVSFTANDGFNLLERLKYIDISGKSYTGLKSQWDVIKDILSDLSLDYNGIYVGISTTIDGVTLNENETIFHKTYVNTNNYVNEDGDPETCRTVLEANLKPYGAFIIQCNGNVYITDLNFLASESQIFKKYSSDDYSFISSETINLNIGDLTSIGFAASDQNMEVMSGINEQCIRYSRYRNVMALDFDAKKDEFKDEEISVSHSYGAFSWEEHFYNLANSWQKSNHGWFCKLNGVLEPNKDVIDYYLKLDKQSETGVNDNTLSFKCVKQLPYLIPSSGYSLKLDLSAYFRTKSQLNNPDEKAYNLYEGFINCLIKIGNKKFVFDHSNYGLNYDKGSWKELTDPRDFQIPFYRWNSYVNMQIQHGYINDTWTDFKLQKLMADNSIGKIDFLIPLNAGFSGDLLEFEIYSWDVGSYGVVRPEMKANVLDVRLNNIKLEIVDDNGKTIDLSDVEYVVTYQKEDGANTYVAPLNRKFKNKGENIVLMHGTNTDSLSVECAGLLTYQNNVYSFIQSWTREGESAIIENLLLRSIVSNYANQVPQVTCSINLPASILGYLTYENFLPGKKMMVQGTSINYAEAAANVTLIEVYKDHLSLT